MTEDEAEQAHLYVSCLDEEDRAMILSHEVCIYPIRAGPPLVPNDHAVSQVVPAPSTKGCDGEKVKTWRREKGAERLPLLA